MGFLVAGFISLSLLVCNSVVAESSAAISLMLAQGLAGVSSRNADNEYTKLGVDKNVTVLLQFAGKPRCTGTFLSPTTVLTARHCVVKGNPRGGVSVDGIPSVNVFTLQEPKENEVKAENGFPYDLAILVFPAGTGEYLGIQSYPPVTEAGNPYISDQTYVVGYGVESFAAMLDPKVDEGFGVRGWATNEVAKVENGLIYSKPVKYTNAGEHRSLEMSNGLPGDSGGALYNSDGVIIGVLSTMKIEQELVGILPFLAYRKGFEISNAFLDMSGELARGLIRTAIHCGDNKPCAGNFAGSQEESNEEGAAQKERPNLFPKFAARTGIYRSASGEARSIIPIFQGGHLEQLNVRKITGNKYSAEISLQCFANECENLLVPTERIKVEKDKVYISQLARSTSDLGLYAAGDAEEYYRD